MTTKDDENFFHTDNNYPLQHPTPKSSDCENSDVLTSFVSNSPCFSTGPESTTGCCNEQENDSAHSSSTFLTPTQDPILYTTVQQLQDLIPLKNLEEEIGIGEATILRESLIATLGLRFICHITYMCAAVIDFIINHVQPAIAEMNATNGLSKIDFTMMNNTDHFDSGGATVSKSGSISFLLSKALKSAGDFPEAFDDILHDVARKGCSRFPWTLLRLIIACKTEQVFSSTLFPKRFQHPAHSNSESLKPLRVALSHLWTLTLAPFSVQRAAELLLFPKRYYRLANKLAYSLTRTLGSVTSPLRHSVPKCINNLIVTLNQDTKLSQALITANPGPDALPAPSLFALVGNNQTPINPRRRRSSALSFAEPVPSEAVPIDSGVHSLQQNKTHIISSPSHSFDPQSQTADDVSCSEFHLQDGGLKPVNHIRRRRSRNSFEMSTPRRGAVHGSPNLFSSTRIDDYDSKQSFEGTIDHSPQLSNLKTTLWNEKQDPKCRRRRRLSQDLLSYESPILLTNDCSSLASTFLHELNQEDDDEDGNLNENFNHTLTDNSEKYEQTSAKKPKLRNNSSLSLDDGVINMQHNIDRVPETDNCQTDTTSNNNVFSEILALSPPPSQTLHGASITLPLTPPSSDLFIHTEPSEELSNANNISENILSRDYFNNEDETFHNPSCISTDPSLIFAAPNSETNTAAMDLLAKSLNTEESMA